MEKISYPSEIQLFFNEIETILKPDGQVFIVEPPFHVSKSSFEKTIKKANENMGRSVPFNRSYWVVPGKFLAGCYPGSVNKDKAYLPMR